MMGDPGLKLGEEENCVEVLLPENVQDAIWLC